MASPLLVFILKVAGTDENADFLADIDKARFEGLAVPCFVASFSMKRVVRLKLAWLINLKRNEWVEGGQSEHYKEEKRNDGGSTMPADFTNGV